MTRMPRAPGAVACAAFPGHAHDQPVRADRGVIAAERQQRRAGQPPQRLINLPRYRPRLLRPDAASTPASPAAYSSARDTPAVDSSDTTSMTARHSPVPSAAATASRDSSTASATPCGYGSPCAGARYSRTGSDRSRSRYIR